MARPQLAFRIFFGVAVAAFLLLVALRFVAPLVLAAVTAVIVVPLHSRIEGWLGRETTRAALLTLLTVTVFLGAPLAFAALVFFVQARGVAEDFLGLADGEPLTTGLSRLLDQALEWLETLSSQYTSREIDLRAIAVDRLQDLGSTAYQTLPDIVQAAAALSFDFVVFAVVLFFFLRDGRRFVDLAVSSGHLDPRYSRQILERLEATIRAVFVGSVLTAAFQATVGAFGLMLVGFRSFVIWGALLFLASFLPVVGSALIWFPMVVYLAANGQGTEAVLLLAVGVFISTTDNVLRLFLIGARTTLHPLILFLAVFAGLAFAGPVGIVYGILLAATLVEAARIRREEGTPAELGGDEAV